MEKKNKISKDIVPEGFSLKLCLFDLPPVIFFGLAFILLGIMIGSITFTLGAILCLISGIIKVIWKFIVVIKKKNLWWAFIQMRILMPIGFLVMIIGLIVSIVTKDLSPIFNSFINVPTLLFYFLGLIGITLMVIFAIKLDSSDAKHNWIEQFCNGLSQLFFFIGTIIAFII